MDLKTWASSIASRGQKLARDGMIYVNTKIERQQSQGVFSHFPPAVSSLFQQTSQSASFGDGSTKPGGSLPAEDDTSWSSSSSFSFSSLSRSLPSSLVFYSIQNELSPPPFSSCPSSFRDFSAPPSADCLESPTNLASSSVSLNAFFLPQGLPCECVSPSLFKEVFPVRGNFVFRFKTPSAHVESGYVWRHVVEEVDEFVPCFQGRIVCQALQLPSGVSPPLLPPFPISAASASTSTRPPLPLSSSSVRADCSQKTKKKRNALRHPQEKREDRADEEGRREEEGSEEEEEEEDGFQEEEGHFFMNERRGDRDDYLMRDSKPVQDRKERERKERRRKSSEATEGEKDLLQPGKETNDDDDLFSQNFFQEQSSSSSYETDSSKRLGKEIRRERNPVAFRSSAWASASDHLDHRQTSDCFPSFSSSSSASSSSPPLVHSSSASASSVHTPAPSSSPSHPRPSPLLRSREDLIADRLARTESRIQKKFQEAQERRQQELTKQQERLAVPEAVQQQLERWAKSGIDGKYKDIRTLLSTVHEVLWPEAEWEPVPISVLMISSQVKRHYRKALLLTHPDKHQSSSAEQLFRAEKIFQAFNEAFKAHPL